MRISDLSELEHCDTRALVVNMHTELATTLAVASLRTNARPARMLVVDLDSTCHSRSLLSRLSTEWGIDVLESSGTAHGHLLDHLVTDSRAEFALLCDSDAEIRDPTLLATMRSRIDERNVFGAGFMHPEELFDATRYKRSGPARFRERFWPVCVLLRIEAIRAAREAGISFLARWSEGDESPTFHDTGADIGDWLRSAGWRYASLGDFPHDTAPTVGHAEGLTWQLLQGRYSAVELASIHEQMIDALGRHGVDWNTFAIPPTCVVPA